MIKRSLFLAIQATSTIFITQTWTSSSTSTAFSFSISTDKMMAQRHLGSRTGSRLTRHFATISSLNVPLKDPSLLPQDIAHDCGKTGFFNVYNPASMMEGERDENVVARVKKMNGEDAKAAIDKCKSSFPSWRDTTGQHRGKILSKWSALLHENLEDLACIMTLESGKPLPESRGEIAYGASFLDLYAAEAVRPSSTGGGTLIPTPFTQPSDGTTPRGTVMAWREPVGVTAMITPWNFPLAMITRKVGPALAAGCTAVVKPSEWTPLSAMAAHTLARRAGVPDGVFELVTAHDRESSASVGIEFCQNPIVKKISFTGSTTVGKLLMKRSSDTVKRVSLELGGNAPFLIFPDADLDQAVAAAVASKYRNAGQTCVCADRFLVHTSIHQDFMSKFKSAVQKLVVGPGMENHTTMGPLISPTAVKSVQEKVDEAIEQGAECVIGGHAMPEMGPNFFQPTILDKVKPTMKIWHTETFGPVAPVVTFDTDEEALDLANDSSAGLAAYFCSRDVERIFRVAQKLESGMVGVNEGVISNAHAPFGGVKESGIGREGSSMGIDEYVETKYVFLNS